MGPPLAASRPVRAAAHRLRIDVVTADTVQRLREAGIPSLVLKGPSTARWLYDPSDCRTYVDSDILVPPPMHAAELVLKEGGFQRLQPARADPWPMHAVTWERLSDGAQIDLHRSFHGVSVDDARAWAAFARHAEPLEVGGIEVAVLDLPARTLIVALHAAAGNPRRRVVEDLDRALARVPTELWSEASGLAGELGATVPFTSGLRLLPEGRNVASELGLPEAPATWWVLRGAADPRLLGSALRLEWMASLPTFREKARFAVQSLFPHPFVVRHWMSRNPGGPQWVPLGYARRIAAKAWMAPAAFREWQRARDKAS